MIIHRNTLISKPFPPVPERSVSGRCLVVTGCNAQTVHQLQRAAEFLSTGRAPQAQQPHDTDDVQWRELKHRRGFTLITLSHLWSHTPGRWRLRCAWWPGSPRRRSRWCGPPPAGTSPADRAGRGGSRRGSSDLGSTDLNKHVVRVRVWLTKLSELLGFQNVFNSNVD